MTIQVRYSIQRPPLLDSFALPSREELLSLRIGDDVKLIFIPDQQAIAERMWVKITDQTSPDEWRGTLDNDPFDSEAFGGLSYKDEVRFHPLDSIDFIK